ncbi:MAG: electron transfer flavoprotein subunit alpha/FixB family protein [candidate division WOR-3 bacterium]|uniref:Electron transfer flavoprotein subunit alpha/FixB family protein n=1 Tax=candidate division WOR-3 bacterium TaxID=2052148 RepID=A0A7C1SXH2_UNCW3|nr:electron transfer flavoprotein subunit alpha/FixB family protein [candidate division WOR-3 bacterium]
MVLVFCEQREGSLRKVAFEALLVGYKIAETRQTQLSAVILGNGVQPLGQEVVRFGVSSVLVVDNPALEHYTPEGYADILTQLVKQYQPETVVFSASANGKDLAATLAAHLETALLPDCTAVEFDQNGTLIATRPIYAGKALATVRAPDARPLVISIRPRAVGPAEEKPGNGTVVAAQLTPSELRTRVADVVKTVLKTVELTEADIVISGGRGMKGPENYALLEELAAVLNAAVGASRAAVDAGWRDHQFQVGQTGKTVAPSLYIACGISGAIQHLVGMINSKCIVAINKDPEANIFKVADYGIVGDLFQVVPLLIEEFKKVKQS